VARSRWWYPVVGLGLGAILGGWTALWASRLTSPALGAFLVLLAWVGLTGALHLDGLCDCCDGLFGGRTADDRLRVMRDPHLGTFGLAGGVLLLLGKFVALEAIVQDRHGPWVIGAAVLAARCLVVCVAAGSPYPRPEGTGKAFIEATQRWEGWLNACVAALASLAAAALPRLRDPGLPSPTEMLIPLGSFSLALLAVMGLKWFCRRRLGGITGDCLGAAIEMAEGVFLLTAAILFQSVVRSP